MDDDGFHGITIALSVMAILWFSRASAAITEELLPAGRRHRGITAA
jgi:hypothetical protein